MSEWMIKCATLFKPIIDVFHEHLLQQSVVQADETALKVLKEDKSTCSCGFIAQALTRLERIT